MATLIDNTHYTIKVKDICQYLDLNIKIKANSRNCTKHLENFKISLTFLYSVYASYSNFSAFKSKVVTSDISDHFPILLINNLPKPTSQCTSLKFTKRKYITQATLDNIKAVRGTL